MPSSPASTVSTDIFISYAREDQPFARELKKHLKVGDSPPNVWYDADLNAGCEWEPDLLERFRSARIIVLLISPDFFNSDYIEHRELPLALERHRCNQAIVVPVIIRACQWKRSKVAELAALPANTSPLRNWPDADQFYAEVATSLRERLGALTRSDSVASEPPDPKDGQHTQNGAAVPVRFSGPKTGDQSQDQQQTDGRILNAPAVVVSTDSGVRVRSEPLHVVICFIDPLRQHKLVEIRKWKRKLRDPLFDPNVIRITNARTVEEALSLTARGSPATVIVVDGFEPGGQHFDLLSECSPDQTDAEWIYNSPEFSQEQICLPTASLLGRGRQSICSDETLLPALRKALLRARSRRLFRLELLTTSQQLQAYFELRYRVWTELGYLSDSKQCPEFRWELDYTDRTAIPVGFFSREDDSLVGIGRLVRGLGEECQSLVRTISRLVNGSRSEILKHNFGYPQAATHPFDILGEMARFQEYYRGLVRKGVRKAELSRIIVDPGLRRTGLGEVIVDSLCGLAKSQAIDVLFLACHAKHAEFYQRCNFRTIDGVTGSHFLSYPVPCIAMERVLSRDAAEQSGSDTEHTDPVQGMPIG